MTNRTNADWNGYPLPVPVDDGERICVLMTIPNRPEYRTALRSQVDDLKKWLFWQKTGGFEAAQAAQLWKQVQVRFIECENVVYPDENGELVNMNINVTQNCGGGCGCGGGRVMEYLPPGFEDVPKFGGGSSIGIGGSGSWEDEYSSQQEYDAAKCDLAAAMVDDFISTIEGLAVTGGLYSVGGILLMDALVSTGALSGAVAGLMAIGLTFSGAFWLLLAGFFVLATAGGGLLGYMAGLANELQNDRQQIVCDIYVATDAGQVRAILQNATSAAVVRLALDSNASSTLLNFALQLIDWLMPDEIIVGVINAAKNLNDNVKTAEGNDCTACGFSGALPAILVSTDWQLQNGWTTGGNQLINSDGQSNTGQDYCAVRGFCKQGVVLPAHAVATTSYLRNIFTALSTSPSFSIDATSYDNFGQDLRVSVRRVSDNVVVDTDDFPNGAFWVPEVFVFTPTGLVVGTEYYLEFSGNGMIVSFATEA